MLRNSVSIGSCLVFASSWLTWIASERTELFVDRSACEVPQFKFASRQMRRKKYLQMQIEPQQTSNEFPSPRLFRMHKAERLILRSLSNRNYHGNSSQTLPNLSSECIIPQLPAAPRLLPLKRNSVTADKRRDTFSGFRNENVQTLKFRKISPGKISFKWNNGRRSFAFFTNRYSFSTVWYSPLRSFHQFFNIFLRRLLINTEHQRRNIAKRCIIRTLSSTVIRVSSSIVLLCLTE